jgi:hypothetical protein
VSQHHDFFETSDGYLLKRVALAEEPFWTDGDLEFADVKGVPHDREGEPVEGRFLSYREAGETPPEPRALRAQARKNGWYKD